MWNDANSSNSRCSYAVIHFDRKDTKSNRCTRKISATNYISIISKNTWRFLVDSNVLSFINLPLMLLLL